MGYITYHHYHGDTSYSGAGIMRIVYFTILISHILLSVVQVPMILGTLYFALGGKLQQHKKLARATWPVWLYVSVSGVAVYWLLHS